MTVPLDTMIIRVTILNSFLFIALDEEIELDKPDVRAWLDFE